MEDGEVDGTEGLTLEGFELGEALEGFADGLVGKAVGTIEGILDGLDEGDSDEGLFVGAKDEGFIVGFIVGNADGAKEFGFEVGDTEGDDGLFDTGAVVGLVETGVAPWIPCIASKNRVIRVDKQRIFSNILSGTSEMKLKYSEPSIASLLLHSPREFTRSKYPT